MPATSPAPLFPLRRVWELVRLRYRLQWAQIRNNPAAITVAGLLLVLFVVVLLGALLGGIGIGALAELDRARTVTNVALGATFVNLLLVSVFFGFGATQIFSERTLRRFPLARPERLFLQYGLGLFEPTWLIGLAIYLGCALGAWAVGLSPPWLGLPAAVLLIAANYVLARLLMALIERLVATATGSLVLIVLMQTAFLIPMALGSLRVGADHLAFVQPVLTLTPPAAAAALMTGAPSIAAPFVLLAWWGVPLALLVLLDSRPPAARQARGGLAKWDSPYDRVARLFPPTWEPLVGRALRYYLRSPAVRVSLIVTLPVMAFLITRRMGRAQDDASLFASAVVFAPLGASIVTAAFAANAFGFDGSGLRRLLLCPIPPRLIVRTLAVVPLLIGAAFTWMMAATWMVLSPVPTSGGMLAMLVAHALTGMLVFHALLLWPSVLTPRRVAYDQKFRNDASLGGQLGVIGGMAVILLVPTLVRALFMGESIARHWWWPVLALPAALAWYLVMLLGAERALLRRREQLLFVVEGRGGS